VTCDTCGGWEYPARGVLVSGTHNRLCPFAPVPHGYGVRCGEKFVPRVESSTFDGTYEHPGGEKVAGHKNPPPPGQGGDS